MVMSQSTASFEELRGRARLSPVDDTADALGFPIDLLFAEHPIRRFGEMPSHGLDRLRAALPPARRSLEATHVAVGPAPAMQTDRVRRFDERPLEVAINIRPRRSEPALPAARAHARRGPRIGRPPLGARKPRDIAHIEGNHDR